MVAMTPVQAKDEAYSLFDDAFKAWIDGQPFDCEARYQFGNDPSEPGQAFIYMSMQQVTSVLACYIASEDGPDLPQYQTDGLIFGMVNIAKAEEDAGRKGDLIATAARNILRGARTPSGMWIRNARFNEVPSDDQYYKWRVVAEYTFDEVGEGN